jgi:hypothetical protein
LSAFEKYVHGSNAAKLKIGYGKPLDGTLANLSKTKVKMTIVNNG